MNKLNDLAASELQTAQQTYQHKAEVEQADPILVKAYQFGYAKKKPFVNCNKTLILINQNPTREMEIKSAYIHGMQNGIAEAIENYDLVCAQLKLAEAHIDRMRNK